MDRDKVKAFYLLEAEECPNCHTLREDWVGEDGKALPDPAWTTVERACHGCGRIKRAERGLTEDQRRSGIYVGLAPLVDEQARGG